MAAWFVHRPKQDSRRRPSPPRHLLGESSRDAPRSACSDPGRSAVKRMPSAELAADSEEENR